MDTGIISRRYAKTLLRYAVENQAETSAYGRMQTLAVSLAQVKELQKALENPVLPKEQKLRLLMEASGGGEDEHFVRFLTLVLDKRRERQLLFIAHSYIDLYRAHKHIHMGKLTTAVPLTPEAEERMRRMIASSVNGTVELDLRVDASLKGGFVLQMDSLRMDASVAGQLRHVRRRFEELNS